MTGVRNGPSSWCASHTTHLSLLFPFVGTAGRKPEKRPVGLLGFEPSGLPPLPFANALALRCAAVLAVALALRCAAVPADALALRCAAVAALTAPIPSHQPWLRLRSLTVRRCFWSGGGQCRAGGYESCERRGERPPACWRDAAARGPCASWDLAGINWAWLHPWRGAPS